jgi:hypothetical protein
MNDMVNAWGRHCTAELARHVGESVADLMPEGLQVLAAGLEVMIEKTLPGGGPRVVSSFRMGVPVDFEATPLQVVAHHVLEDVADEMTTYLHRPWPTNAAGVPLHAWTSDGDGVIQLGYRGTGVNAEAAPVELPPFPIPPRPEKAVTVG